jgi:hypothetical protein
MTGVTEVQLRCTGAGRAPDGSQCEKPANPRRTSPTTTQTPPDHAPDAEDVSPQKLEPVFNVPPSACRPILQTGQRGSRRRLSADTKHGGVLQRPLTKRTVTRRQQCERPAASAGLLANLDRVSDWVLRCDLGLTVEAVTQYLQ